MLLEVNGIYSGYGDIEVLHGVSMQLAEPEIVVVLGWNGSGKSTLLKTIMRLIRPMKGTLEFRGQRIDALETYDILRKGISYVPQASGVYPFLSTEENIKMGGYIENDKARVSARLEEVLSFFPALQSKRKKKAHGLSGGERQMVSIARALMLDPLLLLLDEPSLGLDPITLQIVFDKIRELNRAGTSVLMVEQKALRALQLANRAYVLENGEVAYQGRPDELMKMENIKKLYLGA